MPVRRELRARRTENTLSKYLTLALVGGLFGAGLLIWLTIVLWPPGTLVGSLLASLALLLAIALTAHILKRRRYREVAVNPAALDDMTPDERTAWRLEVLAEREQYLELRELKLGRQMRALQRAGDDYIDILEADPPMEELERLVAADRQLIALIESESQRAFDRIRGNRYGAAEGVNTALIVTDVRDFVEAVAKLYRPETEHPLLETEIERIAKTLSSAALHMLVVVDDLPINLKSYNTASLYRLIRRGVSYYGTYKAFRPYLEQGMNLLQLARLALGMNPIAVGGAWVAGKIASHGAKAIGERMLQRQALQLLTDFIRVIAYEAAMLYGSDFRHRDANWVLGAELVNLEIARGDDLRGRDAALGILCNLAVRHEFDRLRLLNHLARRRSIDTAKARPQTIMTEAERMDAATVLLEHARDTFTDWSGEAVWAWKEHIEALLSLQLDSLPNQNRRRSKRRGFRKRVLDVVRRNRRGKGRDQERADEESVSPDERVEWEDLDEQDDSEKPR